MRWLVATHLIVCSLALANRSAPAQPPRGSQLKLNENACALCHSEKSLWTGTQSHLYIAIEPLADDTHWRVGVNCHDCHGGDPTTFDLAAAHATDPARVTKQRIFRPLVEFASADTMCVNCHADQAMELRKSVHAHAGSPRTDGTRQILRCAACHGARVHGLKPVQSADSPVRLENQVATCGHCHARDRTTYGKSAHGKGLRQAGLEVVAVCADCHGAHATYYAADRRSSLHWSNVATTCGRCHRDVDDTVRRSVHGGDQQIATTVPDVRPGSWSTYRPRRKPSCTDCHQSHRLLDPALVLSANETENECGNCHAEQSTHHTMMPHSKLTDHGYTPAARCADCHAAHAEPPRSNPASLLAHGPRRVATCRRCHAGATASFTQYAPHVERAIGNPFSWSRALDTILMRLLLFFFAFFVAHAFLWFVRSFLSTLRSGRHHTLAPDQYALVRFSPNDRALYLVMLVAFLGMIITGLELKYGTQPWVRQMAQLSGGFLTVRIVHCFFAVVTVIGCLVHLTGAIGRVIRARRRTGSWRVVLFGPDSILPTPRDARDMLGMAKWFVGLGPKPGFERWAYWEKFDYWAVYLMGFVIGLSGLMIWYPNVFCHLVPGTAINAAQMVHVDIALMAATFLFVFHFFDTHFRPEKFPADLSAITGLVSEDHLRKHRPAYVARLEREGRLDMLRRAAPSRMRLELALVVGVVTVTLGLLLLAMAVVAALGH